jgi:ribonuclease T1
MTRPRRSPWGAWILAALLLFAAGLGDWAQARSPAPDQAEAVATVRLEQLPAEAVETYRLILQGGPFPFEKDGSVFGNRERQLPLRVRGYYREYTVKTPGSRDRGARRIVCGGEPRRPEVCYYTEDHYASFRRIVE